MSAFRSSYPTSIVFPLAVAVLIDPCSGKERSWIKRASQSRGASRLATAPNGLKNKSSNWCRMSRSKVSSCPASCPFRRLFSSTDSARFIDPWFCGGFC